MPLKKKLRIAFYILFGIAAIWIMSGILYRFVPAFKIPAVGIWIGLCLFTVLYYLDRVLPFVNVFSKAPNYLSNSSQKTVAVTFDDGPSPMITPRVLDILKEKNVKATFFCIAKHVEQYPEIAKRILQEGHTIANHSYSHRSLPKLTIEELRAELDHSMQVFQTVLGKNPDLFRCPKGYKSRTVQKEVEKRNMKLAGFSYPIWDVDNLPAETLINNTLSKLKNGSIVLMHDGAISQEKSNRSQLLIALPFILEEIKERGFQMTPLTPEIL